MPAGYAPFGYTDPDPTLVGTLKNYHVDGRLSIFVWPPLANSRMFYGKCGWMVIWVVPWLLAGCGFFLQNFGLHIGTYRYVHRMLQHDLVRTKTMEVPSYVEHIPLTFGEKPENVSFGSLDDPVASALGEYQKVDISILDKLAGLFPFLFVLLAVAMDKPMVWTRIMLCFFCLSVGKGLFGWITVVPDSNGWQTCKARLATGSYPIEWYAKERSVMELLFEQPLSRLCADMMWSGHTYFVTIFAFGLHECVRRAMRASTWWKRVLVESLVCFAAILQQSIEVYFVLKSRFHYTSDVVMAILITYLFYTNTSIAVLASWWTKRDLQALGEVPAGSAWLHGGLLSEGHISLGCCCCGWSQQWVYNPTDIKSVVDDIEATCRKSSGVPQTLQMVTKTKQILVDEMGLLHPRSIMPSSSCPLDDDSDDDSDYDD